MSHKLIVYGDIGMDIFVQVDQLPQAGQDAIASNFAMLPGGAVAHTAVVAARLGAPVMFVGLTGQDQLADLLLADLRQHQVDTTYLQQVAGPTATILAVVDQQGERTMYSYRGVSTTQAYGEIPGDLFAPGDCLHLSGYSFQDRYSRATALALLAQARDKEARVSLDPSFHFARAFRAEHQQALGKLDWIFPNQEEAQLMSGASDPAAAAQWLQATGIKTVVVKRGRQGCTIATPQGIIQVPSYPVDTVIDTTGAGDAFCGGFLAATLAGAPIVHAAQMGHAAAAYVIGQLGGHTGAPTLAQVEQLMQDARCNMQDR